MTGTLSDLAGRISAVNQANGWFEKDRSFSDDIALLHTEVSEAFEEYRKGYSPNAHYYRDSTGTYRLGPVDLRGQLNKPEGIPSELADVLIRVLDTCFRYDIDIDAVVEEKLAYNAQRGHRHGGKRV